MSIIMDRIKEIAGFSTAKQPILKYSAEGVDQAAKTQQAKERQFKYMGDLNGDLTGYEWMKIQDAQTLKDIINRNLVRCSHNAYIAGTKDHSLCAPLIKLLELEKQHVKNLNSSVYDMTFSQNFPDEEAEANLQGKLYCIQAKESLELKTSCASVYRVENRTD